MFETIRTTRIPSLHADLLEYADPASGARHVHLATSQPDLAFLVAFPTVPDASDGRAHILEHLALSGSRRYPVRNPFFSMMRRSTASFMNAFTYADRTVYPFATTDRADFFNLLDVYLDATFFPKLDYLNFRQEGWRHTLADGRLEFQGVVLNEMKGAFADPVRAVYGGITSALLRGTTYAVVSGGDPLAIPDLSHAMLRAFHASHYHPSQAVFMTAGPVDPADIQQCIAGRVLAELPGSAPRLVPQLATVSAPLTATIDMPAQAGREDAWGVQTAWILGESADIDVYWHASLLDAGLLGNAAAPLRKAMEAGGLGRPSRLNGMDGSARQLLFHAGLEGLRAEQVEPARTLVREALERAAQAGVPVESLQAALRDMTYRQRDTGGARMPNVLARLVGAVPVALRGGSVPDAFDSEPALQRLRQAIGDPGFFKGLVRQLLDNPARLDATVRPAPDYFTERAARERSRLDDTQAALTEADRAAIAADSAALETLQRQPADSTLLPRIRPADVSPEPLPLPAVRPDAAGRYLFDIASNGISHAIVQFDASTLAREDWPWLRLYASLRADLGVGDMDYETAGAWRQRKVPGFAVGLEPRLDAAGALRVSIVFQATGLREEHAAIGEVLERYIHEPRFDEGARIAFLVERMVRRTLDNLAPDSDQYAALAATAPWSAQRAFEHATSGAGALAFRGELLALAATPEGVQRITQQLETLHARIVASPVQVLCAGSDDDAGDLSAALRIAATVPAGATAPAAPEAAVPANCALHAPGQVNHCHIAWRVPDQRHPQAPALAVAAELLTHQLLHGALREQGGAYGGRASYMGPLGVFAMNSYRDPRLAATYADFDAAIATLLVADFTQEQLEEAIVTVIKGLDRSTAPFDQVLQAWAGYQRGIDLAARRRYRHGVLACTLDDVRAAAAHWLRDGTPSRAAAAGNAGQDLAGLQLVSLQALATP